MYIKWGVKTDVLKEPLNKLIVMSRNSRLFTNNMNRTEGSGKLLIKRKMHLLTI